MTSAGRLKEGKQMIRNVTIAALVLLLPLSAAAQPAPSQPQPQGKDAEIAAMRQRLHEAIDAELYWRGKALDLESQLQGARDDVAAVKNALMACPAPKGKK
jgi:hypothetical protein